MNRIFLGKPWHWALLAASVGLLWYAGSEKLHVIHFNTFIIGMMLGTAVAVFLIVRLHAAGEQVTREPLVASEWDPDDAGGPARE